MACQKPTKDNQFYTKYSLEKEDTLLYFKQFCADRASLLSVKLELKRNISLLLKSISGSLEKKINCSDFMIWRLKIIMKKYFDWNYACGMQDKNQFFWRTNSRTK